MGAYRRLGRGKRAGKAPWMIEFMFRGVRYQRSVPGMLTAEDVAAMEAAWRAELLANAPSHQLPDARPFNPLGPGPEWMLVYRRPKERAAREGTPFMLSWPEFCTIAGRAGGRCELTGLAFEWTRADGVRRRPFAPTLDRRDNRLGYTPDNCRLVCCAVNISLNEWGEETFAAVALAYLTHCRKRPNPLPLDTACATTYEPSQQVLDFV